MESSRGWKFQKTLNGFSEVTLYSVLPTWELLSWRQMTVQPQAVALGSLLLLEGSGFQGEFHGQQQLYHLELVRTGLAFEWHLTSTVPAVSGT